MKVVCEIRNDNNFKKIKIISSMILLFSALFVIRVKLYSETKICGAELNFSQMRNSENSKNQILQEFYSEENKERIIVSSENGVIYNSMKQQQVQQQLLNYSDQFSLSQQTQKSLQTISEHLNKEQANSIYLDDELCGGAIQENPNEEQPLADVESLYNIIYGEESFNDALYNNDGQQNSFGDF